MGMGETPCTRIVQENQVVGEGPGPDHNVTAQIRRIKHNAMQNLFVGSAGAVMGLGETRVTRIVQENRLGGRRRRDASA